MELTITHLYPQHMNLYGDLGNVICLQKRCEWRGIKVNVKDVDLGDNLQAGETDIYFFGGGQDLDQVRVFHDLVKDKSTALTRDLEAGVCMLAICGGYQLLGEYFLESNGARVEGLNILPIETVAPGPEMKQRAVGNLITDISAHPELINHYTGLKTLVGFENHSGRTRFKDKQLQPLGNVLIGAGDNEDQQHDGVLSKGIIGSYMHGSLLPKNPHLADVIITRALAKKYGGNQELKPLDDTAEVAAHKYMLTRYHI